MAGFIKIQRDIKESWIYKNPIYLKAWIDILMNVNYCKSAVRINGKVLNCDVGEALFSLDSWAAIFGRKEWTKDKVRRFFKRLANEHYISTEGDTGTTRLRVLESISYEEKEHEVSTIIDTPPTRHPTPSKEKEKEKEKEKKYKYVPTYLEVSKFFKEQTGKNIVIKEKPELAITQGKYKILKARLESGATIDEIKNVIQLKSKQWRNDPKMNQYLTFDTLFNNTNFEKYLDELANENNKPIFTNPKEEKPVFRFDDPVYSAR